MANKSIILKNYLNVFIEKVATAVAIKPGFLLEETSAGLVQAHSTEGGNVAPVMVALADDLQGGAIGTSYATSARINIWIPQRGDQGYLYLVDGETVVKGDLLESDGAGSLKKHVADSGGPESPNAIVAKALEAVDLSASSNLTAIGRIEVEFV